MKHKTEMKPAAKTKPLAENLANAKKMSKATLQKDIAEDKKILKTKAK